MPLSYALIALLATLVLGAVLLTTLQLYYEQRERLYLIGNAEGIGAALANLVALDVPPQALEAQLTSLAFLSQTRVRLFGPSGALIADSGPPDERQQVAAVSLEVEVDRDGLSQAVTRTIGMPDGATRYTSVIIVEQSGTPAEGQIRQRQRVMIGDEQLAGLDEPVPPPSFDGAGEGAGSIRPPVPPPLPASLSDATRMISLIPAIGTQFGFGLGEGSGENARRSSQVVRHILHDDARGRLGYIELSEGPAYGREIVESVARAWLVAGAASVLLAALAGWLASRRIVAPLLALTRAAEQMGDGIFSARAGVRGDDELGLLAASFNAMADRVEGTVNTLSRFVADAAHELQTPVTALRTNLELAATNADRPQAQYIAEAQAQVERLERLANSLLDLSRLESGAGAETLAPVNLAELLPGCSELYASRAEQAGLTFTLDMPGDPVMVPGNAAQLCRAIGNLLDNAVKFTPEGGVVRAGLTMTGEWVEVWVEDTGIGIPADDLPLLFSRFHRGRNAAAYPGSGLGLAIVKAIAEKHGGQVTARPASPGARFSLRLPRAEP